MTNDECQYDFLGNPPPLVQIGSERFRLVCWRTTTYARADPRREHPVALLRLSPLVVLIGRASGRMAGAGRYLLENRRAG